MCYPGASVLGRKEREREKIGIIRYEVEGTKPMSI
jgi:hypothetical protein